MLEVPAGTLAVDTKRAVQVNLSVFLEVRRWYQMVAVGAEGEGRQAVNHSSLKVCPRDHSYIEEQVLVVEVAEESPSTRWLQDRPHCSGVTQGVEVAAAVVQETIGKEESEPGAASGVACRGPGAAEAMVATRYHSDTWQMVSAQLHAESLDTFAVVQD